MNLVWSWIVAFGRFWYDYIFGDDWTVAVAIFIGLALAALLNSNRVVAWWVIPVIVFIMLGVSLRRARPRKQ